MKLHYNADGSINVTVNLKGQKINMIFLTKDDYNNFLKVLF